jgi:class 3 adenylate cyclase
VQAVREPDATLPAGERRQLTVLFCDLVGSTPLSQQLDAEEWRDVVTRYHATARAAVERFGGHVAQLLGDGLLVYFGWPTAREDDPERAIRAGLAMLDAMGPLNAELALPDGVRLAVRIGMHTGAVVVAADGAIFGDTANIAARVQSAAEPAPTPRVGHCLVYDAERRTWTDWATVAMPTADRIHSRIQGDRGGGKSGADHRDSGIFTGCGRPAGCEARKPSLTPEAPLILRATGGEEEMERRQARKGRGALRRSPPGITT